MQTSDKNRAVTVNHRKVKTSTTLNRRYTRRPATKSDVAVKIKRSPKVQRFNRPEAEKLEMQMQQEQIQQRQMQKEKIQQQQTIGVQMQKEKEQKTKMMTTATQIEKAPAPAMPHPMQNMANMRMRERAEVAQGQQSASKYTAKQLKDQAIQKALASAEKVTTEEGKNMTEQVKAKKKSKKLGDKMHFSFGRIMLATACAAAAVFAIAYFVNLNMPDISLRVAAMQTGIDPTYPNYVPRDYSVSSITSQEGKITMNFANSNTGESFTLIEEKSSWDTNALLSNFVKQEYDENYSIVREQGLTIYVSGSDAAWVNGGILYKIDTTSGTLTNKQIRSIAVSL